MSKFFFQGKANNNNDSGSASYGNKKTVKLGTDKAPAQISVQTEARKTELEALFAENKWSCEITVDADKAENTRDLDILQSKVERAVSTKKANRNDPCPCGSEKKYKKCCGA
jgi:SWIM/SEC-C metal-binding protein